MATASSCCSDKCGEMDVVPEKGACANIFFLFNNFVCTAQDSNESQSE